MRKVLHSPLFFLFLIWLLFSFPYFFLGKVPFPSSYQVNFFSPWSAYPEFASPYKNGATPDVVGQIYPWREFTISQWKIGHVPLWNPYSFSGTFHLANYQSAVFSPMNIGFFILPFVDWWSIMILLQPLLAGVFVVLYLRSLKLNWFSQCISGVAFMFCGFLVTWMMYGTLGYAIIYLPLALYAIEKFFITKKYRYIFLLFLTIPLSFFSGHFQISLYFLLFILYYILARFIQTKDRISLFLFVAVFLGIIASSVQILPSVEAYSQSLRSGIFQKTEAIPWQYLPTFVAPDFFGNPVTRNAWFGHYAEWNAYIGIIPLFFAIYSLLYLKRRQVLIFAVPLFISIFLAFTSPLLDLLVYFRIPVLSTSAASRIIVLYSFSASILAGYGLAFFMEDIMKKKIKRIIIVSLVFIGIFAFLWIIIFGKLFLKFEELQIAFSNIRLPSLIFLLLLSALFLLYVFKDVKKQRIILFIVLVIALLDSMRFATKWQPFESKSLVFAPTQVSSFLEMLPEDNYRVFMNSGAEGLMHNKMFGIEGYDAVYIKRYGNFISSIKTGELEEGMRSVVEFPRQSVYATQAANLLGIKYIIHKVSDGQNVWEFPFWRYSPETLRLIYDDEKYEILENTNVYPRAFLVENVVTENNSQKILDIMFDPQTNLLEKAVVEAQVLPRQKLSSGSAKIKDYSANRIEIETLSDDHSFLVLTDSYAPGWKVYVNGTESKIYRTNFSFRGVYVLPGESSIVFAYEPQSFKIGMTLSIAGFIGILLLIVLKRRFL